MPLSPRHGGWRRTALWFALGLVVAAVGTLTWPLPEWRTGRQHVAPLALSTGDHFSTAAQRIWVDTDAACGTAPRADPDDCLALLLLAGASQSQWAGISTVFGNAALDITDRTTRQLVAALSALQPMPAVHAGAAQPSPAVDPVERPAARALREALQQGRLTIVALGPLTNVAAALQGRPDLQQRVERLVAVMGRRPGHLFHPSEGAPGAMLLGHGPVFRDLNVVSDPHAAAAVVRMSMPLVLVPYDAARHVELTAADLARLRSRGGAPAWVAERATGWLDYWRDDIGRSGFYPFDLLAASFALRPDLHRCASVSVRVGTDPTLWPPFRRQHALLAGPHAKGLSGTTLAEGSAVYCPGVADGLHAWLAARLGGS
jgi:purine nucleosidase